MDLKDPRRRPGFILFFVSFLATVVALCVNVQWFSLPEPKPVTYGIFSADSVKSTVEHLANCGFKYPGNWGNEICAKEYVKNLLFSGIVKNESVSVDELVNPSGAFFIDFLGGLTSVYHNMTNIVATLGRKTVKDSHIQLDGLKPLLAENCAIMLSAHYDSALGTVGSSDNGAQVGILLEIWRILNERGGLPGGTELVLAFNGGEETIMQGAHAFTQVSKNRNICAFINLEAAGAGGREVLFQVGPRNLWLARAWAASGRPYHGSSFLGALFSSGIIPAETDFRVFRDFGNMSGFDFAQAGGGYVYHTARDNPSSVDYGTVQRFGEQILRLIISLDCALEKGVSVSDQQDEAIFFDFLGSHVFVYGMSATAFWLHTSIAEILVVGGLLISRPSFRGIFRLLFAWLAAITGGLVWPAVVSICRYFSYSQVFLKYYARPGLLVPLLFVCPSFFVFLVFLRKTRKFLPPPTFTEFFRDHLHARIIFGILMCILTALQSPTSFLPMLWAGPPLLFPLISAFVPGLGVLGMAGGYVLPLAVTIDLGLGAIGDLLVPLTGRSGTVISGDWMIGGLVGFFVGGIGVGCSDLVERRKNLFFRVEFIFIFLFFVGLVIAIFENPYSVETPQRLFVQQVQQFRADNSIEKFLVLTPVDGNGLVGFPDIDHIEEEKFRNSLDFIYNKFLPFPFPVSGILTKSWILQENSMSRDYGGMVSLDRRVFSLSDRVVRMKFFLKTLGYVNTIAIPAEEMVGWSFGDLPETPRKDCNCFFVKITDSTYKTDGVNQIPHEISFFVDWKKKVGQTRIRAEIHSHFGDLEFSNGKNLFLEKKITSVFFSTVSFEIKEFI